MPASPARCSHQPPCPPAAAPDRFAAAVMTAHPEQGWSLLCNGVIVFDDTGALVAGQIIPPHRAAPHALESPAARRPDLSRAS